MRTRAGWRAATGVAAVVSGLAATSARGETELLGPLRIRDMTPFNPLRLDMLPAHAVSAGPGSWTIETDLSYSNTCVMSDNVQSYLEARGERRPQTQTDADAILALGRDLVYGFAVTENAENFANTPDIGVSLTLAWIALRP